MLNSMLPQVISDGCDKVAQITRVSIMMSLLMMLQFECIVDYKVTAVTLICALVLTLLVSVKLMDHGKKTK